MESLIFLCIMLMIQLATISGASVRILLATVGTIAAVIGSAFINTGIGTGGWLLATVPLSPLIFGLSYVLVYAVQAISDWLGQAKFTAGLVTLTAVMLMPNKFVLLAFLCSPFIYYALLHSMRYVWQRLADEH